MTLREPASLAGAEVDRLIESAATLTRRDAERCRALLERAESALSGQQDLARSARLSEVRGNLALGKGDLGAAATAYRLARRNWLAVGRRLDAHRALIGCAEVQLMMGELEDAEASALRVQAELALEPHEAAPVTHLSAAVQRQLADARARMGQLPTAHRHYTAAENLYASLGDLNGLAMVHLRRGLAALDAHLGHTAVMELVRARSMFRAVDEDRPSTVVLVLVAEALSSAGQVSRAIELLDCLHPDVTSRWARGAHAVARANALLRGGFPAEAHAEARAAQEAFTEIGAVEYYARATLACGTASLRWGRTKAAAGELAVAESLFGECGSALMRAWTWLVQADLALATGDTDAARACCERIVAADLDEAAPYLGVQARLRASQLGDGDTAAAVLDTAADLATRSGSPELRVDVLVARARLERRLGRPAEATESLRNALSAGRTWAPLGDGSRSTAFSPALAAATQELVDLLLERDDHTGRLEAWRRARASSGASTVPFVERTRASTLTDQLRRQRIEELVTETHGATDASAQGEEPLPPVPSEPVVEYYVMHEDVVAFVIRDGQVDARVLHGVTAESRRLVRAWQQECRLMAAGAGIVGEGFSTPSPALEGLHDMLVAPISDLLADLDEELCVIGHRHLHAVPFDALLDGVGPWYPHVGAVDPSPSRLAATGLPPEPATLVLAVPDDSAPLIMAEAEMIFRTLPGAEVLIGPEANRATLARHGRSADIIHLACHGVFRQENPLASALRLGDGWLAARDIAGGGFDLAGAVVVLSACGSGLSPDYLPEPIGLASACVAAGAMGVVAALWTVDDAVTFELMTHFYAAIAEGAALPAALRSARREVARQHPHPYYWAGFRYVAAPARGAPPG